MTVFSESEVVLPLPGGCGRLDTEWRGEEGRVVLFGMKRMVEDVVIGTSSNATLKIESFNFFDRRCQGEVSRERRWSGR